MKFDPIIGKMLGKKKINSKWGRAPYLAHNLKTAKWGSWSTAHAQKNIRRFWTSSDLLEHVQKML